ncbi:hypothetical protein V8D89_009253 [Ganoderma adspersum]
MHSPIHNAFWTDHIRPHQRVGVPVIPICVFSQFPKIRALGQIASKGNTALVQISPLHTDPRTPHTCAFPRSNRVPQQSIQGSPRVPNVHHPTLHSVDKLPDLARSFSTRKRHWAASNPVPSASFLTPVLLTSGPQRLSRRQEFSCNASSHLPAHGRLHASGRRTCNWTDRCHDMLQLAAPALANAVIVNPFSALTLYILWPSGLDFEVLRALVRSRRPERVRVMPACVTFACTAATQQACHIGRLQQNFTGSSRSSTRRFLLHIGVVRPDDLVAKSSIRSRHNTQPFLALKSGVRSWQVREICTCCGSPHHAAGSCGLFVRELSANASGLSTSTCLTSAWYPVLATLRRYPSHKWGTTIANVSSKSTKPKETQWASASECAWKLQKPCMEGTYLPGLLPLSGGEGPPGRLLDTELRGSRFYWVQSPWWSFAPDTAVPLVSSAPMRSHTKGGDRNRTFTRMCF